MPNRILREAILTSERVAALDWAAEVFYRRLHSIIDDYGRYEAGHQLLRAKCYPLQTDTVRVADIARWMAECQKSGLLLVYGVNCKQYLEVQDFRQQMRTASKYPPPPANASKCSQMPTNEHLGVVVGVVVDEVVISGRQAATKKTAVSDEWEVPGDWVAEAATKYPGPDWTLEARRFASHHKAKQSLFANWKQAWWSWVNSPYQKSKPSGAALLPAGGRRRLS